MVTPDSLDEMTGMSAARFGVYVHFPYCLSKCPYCDFASVVSREIPQEIYARAVISELDLRVAETPALTARPLQSVFLGGGTPSLWEPTWVERVLDAIRNRFRCAPGAEITLEANPGAADASRFRGFRQAGVNRLSIGVQSFQESTLRALGREHDGAMAEDAFRAARRAGIKNVSMDFIYGVHGQTLDDVVSDARRLDSERRRFAAPLSAVGIRFLRGVIAATIRARSLFQATARFCARERRSVARASAVSLGAGKAR